MNVPLVSVYIPTKNRPDLLVRAVESVLNQTYKNIEIVVCDDGSDEENFDKYYQIISSYQNVKIINGIGQGACSARNIAVSYCSGDFITGLDDDDIMSPERISVFLDNWSDEYIFLSSMSSFGNSLLHKIKRLLDFDKVVCAKDLFKINYIGNQIFAPRELFEQFKFDVNLPALQDWEMWYRILNVKAGKAKVIGKRTQIIDVGHGAPRITNYENRMKALEVILIKHNLDRGSFHNLILLWNVEFNDSITMFDVIKNRSFHVLKFIFYNKIKSLFRI